MDRKSYITLQGYVGEQSTPGVRTLSSLCSLADFLKNIELQGTDECYVIKDNARIVAVGFLRGFGYWNDVCLGIAVHPKYRGKGYGKLMMRFLHFVAKQRKLKRLRLHVNPDNKPALKLYKKFGYCYTDKRKNGEWTMYKEIE